MAILKTEHDRRKIPPTRVPIVESSIDKNFDAEHFLSATLVQQTGDAAGTVPSAI